MWGSVIGGRSVTGGRELGDRSLRVWCLFEGRVLVVPGVDREGIDAPADVVRALEFPRHVARPLDAEG